MATSTPAAKNTLPAGATPMTVKGFNDKPAKTPVSLVERTKKGLSTAALRGTLKVDEIEVLEAHLAKLKAFL